MLLTWPQPLGSGANIQGLSPILWCRNGQGLTSAAGVISQWNDQSGNGNHLKASGAAQPVDQTWAGTNYLYLPAVASNTVTSPTKSVTGSFTFTLNLQLEDYTPAADVTLVDKSSGNNGFTIKWLTTDKLRFVVGDGAALTNCDATVASGLTDFTQHTIVGTWTDGVGLSLTIDGMAWGTAIAAAKTLTNAAVSITIGSTTSTGTSSFR